MQEKETGIEIGGIGPYLFILPILIGAGIFSIACFFYVICLSLQKVTLIMPSTFVGLSNFIYVLRNEWFLTSLIHTSYYVLWTVPLCLFTGIGIAFAVYKKIKFGSLFRSIYLLPWITSSIIAALTFRYIFNPEMGVVNYIIKLVGIRPVIWGSNVGNTVPILALINSWQMLGFGMIIFIGAIVSIPKELIESALIEGATNLQILWYIILPLIRPIIFFYLVITTISAFQIFDSAYIFSGCSHGFDVSEALSAPVLTASYLTYIIAFSQLWFGKASSMAIVMFLIVLGIILIQRRFIGRKVDLY